MAPRRQVGGRQTPGTQLRQFPNLQISLAEGGIGSAPNSSNERTMSTCVLLMCMPTPAQRLAFTVPRSRQSACSNTPQHPLPCAVKVPLRPVVTYT